MGWCSPLAEDRPGSGASGHLPDCQRPLLAFSVSGEAWTTLAVNDGVRNPLRVGLRLLPSHHTAADRYASSAATRHREHQPRATACRPHGPA